MADFSLSGIIDGDASGFTSAVQEATQALNGFSGLATGFLAGFGSSEIFSNLGGTIKNFVGGALDQASSFEGFNTSISSILGNVSDASQAMAATTGGAVDETKLKAMEAADELIKYNDKVEQLKDEIATVQLGQNVLDVQDSMTSQLETMQQQYADKVQSIQDQIDSTNQNVADRHVTLEQNMQDTLENMQNSHDTQTLDRTDKQQAELAKVQSVITKRALQAKFDAENAMADTAWQRQYDLKKQQEEKRIAEEDARNKAAADKKVALLNDQLAKEKKLEADHEAKLKESSDKRIKLYQEENAKKLELYQRELKDEEMAHKKSLLQEQITAEGGARSGGATTSIRNLQSIAPGEEFASIRTTTQQMNESIDELATKTPFSRMQIAVADREATAMRFNFEKLNPVVADLASAFGKDFGPTMSTVLQAAHGRMITLQRDFGITAQDLEHALGRPIKTANDLMTALALVTRQDYGGTAVAMGNTWAGQLIKIKNETEDLTLRLLGINLLAKQPVEKGGLFDTLYQMVKQVADYVEAHRAEIGALLQNMGESFAIIAKALLPVVEAIVRWMALNPQLLLQIIGIVGAVGVAIPLILSIAGAIILAANPLGVFVLGAIAAAGAIGFIITAAISLRFPLENIKKTFDLIIDSIKALVGWLGKLGGGIVGAVKAFGGMFQAPSFGSPIGGTQAYNYNTQNSSQVQLNNTFNVPNQATASMAASYIQKQISHKGFT